MTQHMIETITGALTTVSAIGTKVVLPAAIPIIAVSENIITEKTGVSLTFVITACGICWYLNGRFTRLEDAVKQLKRNLDTRPCQRNNECSEDESSD